MADGGGGDDDFSRVYIAVATGASEEEVWRIISAYPQGADEQRRAQAVYHKGGANNDETPLQAAHRQRRGDLVGALVEAGADVGGIFGGHLTPLAVCIAYGQAGSVRALLIKGHDPNGKIAWDMDSGFSADRSKFCLPAHFCLAPAPTDASLGLIPSFERGMCQVGCLEVLVKGGADVNAGDSDGGTPILCLAVRHQPGFVAYEVADAAESEAAADVLLAAGARASSGLFFHDHSPLMIAAFCGNARFVRYLIEKAGAPVDERNSAGRTALHSCNDKGKTMALLLDAGAEIEARDNNGYTPLFECARRCDKDLRLLLERGASADIVAADGTTPLIGACALVYSLWSTDEERWPMFLELLRRSSRATRRAVVSADGQSAVDRLARSMRLDEALSDEQTRRASERRHWTIAELLASGASVQQRSAPVVLPIAAALSARQHAELAARRSERRRWRAHLTFVNLSLDQQEMREAAQAVAAKRARLEELERELRKLGAGSGTESSSRRRAAKRDPGNAHHQQTSQKHKVGRFESIIIIIVEIQETRTLKSSD